MDLQTLYHLILANMTSEELIEKIKQGENEKFEIKERITDAILMSRLISSFANDEGGQIVIGIREPFEIIGCNISSVLNIVEQTKSSLKPTPNFSTEIIPINGKDVVVVDVEKSNDLVFSAGSLYQRVGGQTLLMNSQEIKQKLSSITKTSSLDEVSSAIEKQSRMIDRLHEEIKNSNNWKTKLQDHFISGIIGAILGAILAMLLA
jgi:predicted HTH transcriptional regulator